MVRGAERASKRRMRWPPIHTRLWESGGTLAAQRTRDLLRWKRFRDVSELRWKERAELAAELGWDIFVARGPFAEPDHEPSIVQCIKGTRYKRVIRKRSLYHQIRHGLDIDQRDSRQEKPAARSA